MTAQLGTWIVRSGNTLKLQLPPFQASGMFRKELEIRRVGTRLTLRAIQNNFVIWEAQVEVGDDGKRGPAIRLPGEGMRRDNEPEK